MLTAVTVPHQPANRCNRELTGTDGQDDIDGNGGDDRLFGFDAADELFGGEGNDVLSGGEGDDILRGQNGSDNSIGGPDEITEGQSDDDVIYGLGEDSRGILDNLQDAAASNTPLPISPSETPDPDTLTGGAGDDLFYIQETSEDEGFGFFPNQQYAIITDFGNEEGNDDLIRLPGSDSNYTARGLDLDDDGNNESTAIIYTEDADLELGVSVPIPLIGVGADRTLDINSDNALVAIVEDASIRNLTDDNFYTYS